MRGRGVLIARALHLEVQRQFVIGAVDVEDAVHVDLRLALRRKLAIHMIGREGRLGIALAFENLLVHAAIARTRSRSRRW